METDYVITTNEQKCEGCNKCINVCPIPGANIAYSLKGKNKIKIDSKKCIHCGHCIEVCDHGARQYIDDTEKFFRDLKYRTKISILVAPSFRINFKEYKKVLGLLKTLGVNLVYDVAFGAEIYTWACIKAMEEKNQSSIISQACPVIVNYIQKYQSELIEVLLPIHSPMICSAIYLKKYEKCLDGLAFLSPCISKKDEISDSNTIGLVDYNITYKGLENYIKKNQIDLDLYEEEEYDFIGYSLGIIFSKPGGFRENIELYVRDVWIDEIYGQKYAFEYLKEYKDRLKNKLPKPNILDILSCKMGCNMGTAVDKNISNYDIGYLSNKLKTEKAKNGIKDIFEVFDNKLKITDFKRVYEDRSKEIDMWKEPSEDEYKAIFNKLHKYTIEDENVNCFSCGYSSCKTMAKAIYNDINYENNCIYYNKSELQIEINKNKKILKELKYIAFNDPLTNTYNRRGIKSKLESTISKAKLENSKVGIIFIDIDKFKMINDVFGHDEGDRIISNVAERLKEAVGLGGIIGRLGGDEFLAIIDNLYDTYEIKKIARSIVKSFQKPFQLKDRKFCITCSLGICIFPDHGDCIEALLKKADVAMYRVKENCGNGFELYNVEDDKLLV